MSAGARSLFERMLEGGTMRAHDIDAVGRMTLGEAAELCESATGNRDLLRRLFQGEGEALDRFVRLATVDA